MPAFHGDPTLTAFVAVRLAAHRRVFEKLPQDFSRDRPGRFVDAVRPGADLTMIWPHLASWTVTEELPRRTESFPKAGTVEDYAFDTVAAAAARGESCLRPATELLDLLAGA